MYNEKYDNYIRSILGNIQDNIYNSKNENYYIQNNDFENNNMEIKRSKNLEIEEYYPEIYKIIYPMVLKKCKDLRVNITREELENMTDDIYYSIEESREIELNINLTNDLKTKKLNESNINERKVQTNIKENNNKRERTINTGLRDLIKILLIKELLENNFNQQNNFLYPPRPPIRPPYRPGKPPFNRMSNLNDIYEM